MATVDEKELMHRQIQVERKLFHVDLRENLRGQFVRLTEDVGGRRDTVIIPATGLGEIRDALDEALRLANEAAEPSERPDRDL